MDPWAVRRRRRASRAMGVLLCVLCVLTGAAAAGETLRFGLEQATFAWSPPSGIIDGYVVLVSRNGGPETAELVVEEPHATLDVGQWETIVVRVRAFGRSRPDGPILVSGPSVASEAIRFVPAPVWPGKGLLALHCARCESLQLRALPRPVVPLFAPGLAEPWRLEALGALDSDAPFDVLWRNEETGELRTADLGADPLDPDASTEPIHLGPRAVVGVARIQGLSQQVIVLRNVELGGIEFWRVQQGGIRAVGFISAPASWDLAAAEDLDGDGLAELWLQTDRPGRLEVWKVSLSQPIELLARIDTGASGRIEDVADYDGDGRPEPLWRDAQGALTITYFQPGGGGHPGLLEEAVTLPGESGDELLEVRGSLDVDGLPGEEIILQHRTAFRVWFLSPGNGLRAPMFDLSERFELVQAE